MKNVLLRIAVQTTKSLASREHVTAFLKMVERLPSLWHPNLYGFYEPIKRKFDFPAALTQLSPLYEDKGASVDFIYKGPLIGSLCFNTNKGPFAWYNGLELALDYARIKKHLAITDVINVFFEFCRFVRPDYAAATLAGGDPFRIYTDNPRKNWGTIEDLEVPPYNVMGIKCIAGIRWINVLGRAYIRFFGESTLSKLIAFRAEPIANGQWFWLQLTEDPEQMLTAEGKASTDRIAQLLDRPKAFCGYDPRTPGFLVKYETPDFDFSEIRMVNRQNPG
jgi:hypothetical protein